MNGFVQFSRYLLIITHEDFSRVGKELKKNTNQLIHLECLPWYTQFHLVDLCNLTYYEIYLEFQK